MSEPMEMDKEKQEQLSLFDGAENPLEKRLGTDFFDELPKEPGVYRMYGGSGKLLYVGKAKNLRNRLFTYRRVKSDHRSRKTRKLVSMIRSIDYEVCASEQEALLKENALIRQHRPEFNRAKKSPETYYFLTLEPGNEIYKFQLSMSRPEDEERLRHTYGAFKGHRTVRMGSGALLRQLYLLENEVRMPFDFPSALMKNLTPLEYELSHSSEALSDETLRSSLRDFLAGDSLGFIERLVAVVTERDLLGDYIGRLILKDCESLRRFFDYCLSRNRELEELLGLPSRLIPQHKLDDYLIRAAFKE